MISPAEQPLYLRDEFVQALPSLESAFDEVIESAELYRPKAEEHDYYINSNAVRQRHLALEHLASGTNSWYADVIRNNPQLLDIAATTFWLREYVVSDLGGARKESGLDHPDAYRKKFDGLLAARLLFGSQYRRAHGTFCPIGLSLAKPIFPKPETHPELVEHVGARIGELSKVVATPDVPIIILNTIYATRAKLRREAGEQGAVQGAIKTGFQINSESQQSKYGWVREAQFSIDDGESIIVYGDYLQGLLDTYEQTQRAPTESKRQRATADGLQLIYDTINECNSKFANHNAGRLIDFMDQSRTNINNSKASVIPIGAVVKLANIVSTTLNHGLAPEDHFAQLPVSVDMLPEAFRRLMLVVFSGNEADNHYTEQLKLANRFECIDKLKAVLDLSNMKSAKPTPLHGRGELRHKGAGYWRRWAPGAGILS